MSITTTRIGSTVSPEALERIFGSRSASGVTPLMGAAATVTQAAAENQTRGATGANAATTANSQGKVDPVSRDGRGKAAEQVHPEAEMSTGRYFNSIFQLDPPTGEYVLKTYDLVSDEQVSQIPEESRLRMRKALRSWQGPDTSVDGAAIDKLS